MADERDIILKLFSMLKDAIDNVNSSLKDLLTNQRSITSYMKDLPIKDLGDALKEHNKESNDNIDECTVTVETQTKDIMKKLDKIYNIIFKTTVTVGIFMAVVSAIFSYGKFIKPPVSENIQLNKTIMELKKALDEERTLNDEKLEEQKMLIEELRQTVRNLHKKAE